MNTENIDGAPLVGGVRGSRTPTMNNKKYRQHAHWEATPEVPERSSSTLKKHRRWPPWEATPELWECPPSTQKTSTVDPWEAVSEI
jgi:hypothetical protein